MTTFAYFSIISTTYHRFLCFMHPKIVLYFFAAEFRYEGVAVIHKDLKLENGIQSLKGLKSCHTGVGRNVGYKIPITKLKKMGIIGSLNEPELSARENELKAFSTLFSKACIVGKWSPDPKIDTSLSKFVVL